MLFDVLSIWDQIHSRKVASGSLHCRDGVGIRHLGNLPSPQTVPDYTWPHGPWCTREIRGPRLLDTLALCMTFWKCKNWKGTFFSNWTDSKIIFWSRNRWERNQVLRKTHLKQSFPGFAAVSKSITSVKSILWTLSCSVFRRAKLYILSGAMEERKTDLILLI